MQLGCNPHCVSRLTLYHGDSTVNASQLITVGEKLLRFHGERHAQLDSNMSVFEEDHKHNHRSRLFEALWWLFFSTPQIYYEQLSRTWVDNKVNYDSWRNFVGGLQTDWAAYVIPVRLTTNLHHILLVYLGSCISRRPPSSSPRMSHSLLSRALIKATMLQQSEQLDS